MQADYAVELGAEDEVLELPWSAKDQGLQYFDLKRSPDLLINVSEAQRYRELAGFLQAVNSNRSILETAKCDAWVSTKINPEEEIFEAKAKFGSYIDLLFSEERQRYAFADHQNMAKALTEVLKRAPEISSAAEFLIRRCFYHSNEGTKNGFYVTLYLFGYGADESAARQHWAIGMKLTENAILQLSAHAP